MTSESFDMTESIAPRSDQLNAEDLLTGPCTVTIAAVTRGSAEQPVNIVTDEFGPGRPYKPSKSMRRILVAAWGKEASAYVGRRITIYREPEITFGRDKVGGIRISHLSNLDKRLEIALTVTRGKRAPFVVEPLPDGPPPKATPKPIEEQVAAIVGAFDALGVTLDQLEARIGSEHGQWTADDVAALTALGKSIKAGETTTYEEFDPKPAEAEQGDLMEGGE